MPIGTDDHPLRVAVIGSGPTGFYTAEHLFKQKDYVVEVDVYDRLPTPFGLVRGGVAPDHQKIKSVTKAYDRVASKPQFRYYGYVEFGTDVKLDDLKKHYHQVVFHGGRADRPQHGHPRGRFGSGATRPPSSLLGITVIPITETGSSTCRKKRSSSSASVTWLSTFAASFAVAVRSSSAPTSPTMRSKRSANSNVKTVYMLGRRGPAQAAFTNPEIKELGELEVADIRVPERDASIGEATKTFMADNPDKGTDRKVEILKRYAEEKRSGKPKTLVLRFCVSPTELIAGDDGGVSKVKLVKNGALLERARDHSAAGE